MSSNARLSLRCLPVLRVPVACSAAPSCSGFIEDGVVGSLQARTMIENRHGYARSARRLSVEQLRTIVASHFGGIAWTTSRRNGTDMFETIALTLGSADYVHLMSNETDPSPVFVKFMDDMAGQICRKAVQLDSIQADPSRRIVVIDGDDVAGTLRHLRLAFHAIHVPEGSMAGLEDFMRLYEDVLADSGSAPEAWEGVCVAMITTPEFLVY
jgi:hypothetical protein